MKDLKELKEAYEKLGNEIKALETQEFEYAIFCKSKNTGDIVKFTELMEGVVVKPGYWGMGYKASNWTRHTDTNFWEVLPQSNGFYDGQPVWGWDNDDTHYRTLRFYDAKNKQTFYYRGERGGYSYSNYLPYEGEWLDWMLKAFETLEK